MAFRYGCGKADDLSDDDHTGCAGEWNGSAGKPSDRAGPRGHVGERGVAGDSGRSRFAPAAFDQAPGERPPGGQAHEHDERHRVRCYRVEYFDESFRAVARQHDEGRGDAAMRDRYPGERGRRERRADAGNDLVRNTRLGESERFRDTLKMLPDDPQWLLYLDLGFVFDELLESGDLPLDESNPDAIRGFGLSWSRDGELIRISVAVPIEAAP